MRTTSDRYPFTDFYVHRAPDEPGVYLMYKDAELIYVGMARQSIRQTLSELLRDPVRPYTIEATSFSCELTGWPLSRQRDLLQEHERRHGGAPRFQQVLP